MKTKAYKVNYGETVCIPKDELLEMDISTGGSDYIKESDLSIFTFINLGNYDCSGESTILLYPLDDELRSIENLIWFERSEEIEVLAVNTNWEKVLEAAKYRLRDSMTSFLEEPGLFEKLVEQELVIYKYSVKIISALSGGKVNDSNWY